MNLREILSLPFKEITKNENLKVVAKYYKDELGLDVCLSCRGSLLQMITTIKKEIEMTNFELKGNKYYRVSQEDNRVINNNIMSDELALDFLKVDLTRIRFFAKYPSDWEALINAPVEEVVEDASEEVSEEVSEDATEDKVEDSPSLERESLREYKMKELRDLYPDVKQSFGGTKDDFITEILKAQE
jgi:hypothetical protein